MDNKCHDCGKEMIEAKEVIVFGFDGKKSVIKFLVCWPCKRSRVEKS